MTGLLVGALTLVLVCGSSLVSQHQFLKHSAVKDQGLLFCFVLFLLISSLSKTII